MSLYDIIIKIKYKILNDEKSVLMKMNLFDQNKPRKIKSKNNIFAEFLQKSGLYDEIEITKDNIFHLIDLIDGKVKIDEFCPSCKEKRVFEAKPIIFYKYLEQENLHIPKSLAAELEFLQKLGISKTITTENGFSTSLWNWTSWQVEEDCRLMVFRFSCSMDESHKLDYVVLTDDYKFKKVGQFPSVADLSFPELKEYNKILSKDDLKEFRRAIGLHAQGIGIGSYVYLRRIFERIIDTAKGKAISDGTIDEQTYKDSRVDARIKMLANYLPKALVDNPAFYGIVSKGIHELSEEECILYFPVLKDFIFMILRQWEQIRKDEEATKQLQASLSKIAGNIK